MCCLLASEIKEIAAAVDILHRALATSITLLHYVLLYPTNGSDAHLSMLSSLMGNFPDLDLGYSDFTRTAHDNLPLVLAFAMGHVSLSSSLRWTIAFPGMITITPWIQTI